MDPTKLAVGAGAAVLVGGGGYGISTLFTGGNMPGYSPRNVNATNTKYVDNYPDYFVDASKGKNREWWDWVYETRYLVARENKTSDGQTRPEPKQSFIGLERGSGDDKSIQKVCRDVYGVDSNKVKTTGNIGDGEYSEADVWRYCTAVNKKPVLLSSSDAAVTEEKTGYTNNTYGDTKKDKLVAITPQNNAFFWQEQERLFFEAEGGRSGKLATGGSSALFKKLWSKRSGSLKETCEEAYKVDKTNDTGDSKKVEEADLLKFCSLEGK
ncbi:hypothetical protein [Candidatus Mycoplasma haematohominis]|uniref:hypothetical protein n=1 Tax=Candidatus Mycoplasma haematohominis TaxID=1494318 RepID=UPI001C0A6DC5|nr:hypothetical protein [Candidatus Mycoplasma haemohominis]